MALTLYRQIMIRAFLPVVMLAQLLAPASASAAPIAAAPPAKATALLTHPVSIVKTADLDFGMMTSATAAGTVVIDPNANTITSAGGVTRVGAQWSAAGFTGAAGGTAVVVLIKLANQPFALTRQGGSETVTVSSLTLQGQNKRSLAAMETFTFRVGGTLNVGANQVEGVYTGTFDVDIQYP